MATETKLNELKINYLTEAQYEETKTNNQINDNELYMTPDSSEDKEVILYNNSNGSFSTITLSDNAENYEYIEIFYAKATNSGINSTKIPIKICAHADLIISVKLSSNFFQILHTLIKIVGKTITFENGMFLNCTNGASTSVAETNEIKIFRVVGYK